jgi:hypothetical protein
MAETVAYDLIQAPWLRSTGKETVDFHPYKETQNLSLKTMKRQWKYNPKNSVKMLLYYQKKYKEVIKTMLN